MEAPKWVKPLFIVAGLYDGLLAVLFLIVSTQLFSAANIPLPNHLGYIQFPALLLIIFAIMFFNIAKDPIANRNLVLYGILLKVAYCGVVFSYWMVGNIPSIWVPFAFFDLGFLIIFIIAKMSLKKVA